MNRVGLVLVFVRHLPQLAFVLLLALGVDLAVGCSPPRGCWGRRGTGMALQEVARVPAGQLLDARRDRPVAADDQT